MHRQVSFKTKGTGFYVEIKYYWHNILLDVSARYTKFISDAHRFLADHDVEPEELQ